MQRSCEKKEQHSACILALPHVRCRHLLKATTCTQLQHKGLEIGVIHVRATIMVR